MKRYDFNNKSWESDFIYATSPVTKAKKTFPDAEAGVITVGYNEEISDYDYISVITKEKYGCGTTATLNCSFDKKGAPLIVFTSPLGENKVYGLHFEAVVYEGGLNVWHIVPCPERIERPIRPTKLLGEKFEITNNEITKLSVHFLKKALEITVNDKKFTVECEEFPEEFHVGFTACEGICRFYDFTVE